VPRQVTRSRTGLDSVLYLIGFSDRDIAETGM
jgi:hypothetical protein